MQVTTVLDCSGTLCPKPILMARLAIKKLKPGDVLQVISTDPQSVEDFKIFSKIQKFELLSIEKANDIFVFHLKI